MPQIIAINRRIDDGFGIAGDGATRRISPISPTGIVSVRVGNRPSVWPCSTMIVREARRAATKRRSRMNEPESSSSCSETGKVWRWARSDEIAEGPLERALRDRAD